MCDWSLADTPHDFPRDSESRSVARGTTHRHLWRVSVTDGTFGRIFAHPQFLRPMPRYALFTAVVLLATSGRPGTTLSGQGRRDGGSGAGVPERYDPPPGASTRTSGTVSGQVTATGAHGETIDAGNVLVQLWSLDEATSAAREAACSARLADKSSWLQARQEVEYPSGMDLSGTPVGNDVALIRTLMGLRRDTVRSDAKGELHVQPRSVRSLHRGRRSGRGRVVRAV